MEFQKSVDVAVQQTNDASVVSKRSAVRRGYCEDPFLAHFVKKPAARMPLINRGYYLRMEVMTALLKLAIDAATKATDGGCVQVLSLGAGYDTFAARHIDVYENAHFYEVDFSHVIKTKIALMSHAPAGSFPPQLMKGTRYVPLGFDLRDTETDLDRVLHKAGFDNTAPTVVYSECVTQYMPPAASCALVRWASRLTNGVFISYDQINPLDTFGQAMCRSLRSKCSPLLSIYENSTVEALAYRSEECGMRDVRVANFYDLSRWLLSGKEKKRVDALEPFDEFEEWAEMCEHYAILCARSKNNSLFDVNHPALNKVVEERSGNKDVKISKENVISEPWPVKRFSTGMSSNALHCTEFIEDVPFIVSFGQPLRSSGATVVSRFSQIAVYSLVEGAPVPVSVRTTSKLPEIVCGFSFTRLAPWVYLVFGGRTNPSCALDDAYILNLTPAAGGERIIADWTLLRVDGEDGPCARHRQAAAAVSASSVLIVGGKDGSGAAIADVWLGCINNNETILWKQLKTPDLPALCSAAAASVCCSGSENECSGVYICGGLGQGDDEALQKAWYADIDAMEVRETFWTLGPHGRFSHTLTEISDGVLLVFGGVGFDPKLHSRYNPPMLVNTFTRTVSTLELPEDLTRTTFVRHSMIQLRPYMSGILGVIGGGFVPFSFGTCLTDPLVLRIACSDLSPAVGVIPVDTVTESKPGSGLQNESQGTEARNVVGFDVASSFCPSHLTLDRIRLRFNVPDIPYSAEAWRKHKDDAVPCVLRNMPIGTCISLWSDPVYLIERTDGMTAAVHVAHASYLDFVNKNFTFCHVPFPDLVRHIFINSSENKCAHSEESQSHETWYYRSIAGRMRTERSNFFTSFPTLSSDFVLPEEVSAQVLNPKTHHQSCFRFNEGGSQLWTHYDVTDNILVNVVGRKRVILFPVSDTNNLYFKGSSSPVLNLDAPDTNRYPRAIEAMKHAVTVILGPGDCLILPALWLHHITAIDSCISINLFYKRESMVLAGDSFDQKDLYGNKDLPCLVDCKERLLKEIKEEMKAFDQKKVPSEYKALMLSQLAAKLEEYARELVTESTLR